MNELQEKEAPLLKNGLDGLVGNKKSVELLKQGLNTGRVAHAYLFSGPTGVGKKTAASALCQAFNCKEMELVGCGVCSSCSRIQRGLHPDFVVIEPEKNKIVVKQIRELTKRAELGPFEGSALVIVLAPADAMNISAANALLKTLEEPRPNVYFVLTTAAAHALPATIRSRCQMLRFGPVEDSLVKKVVVERTALEKERAGLVARMAEGSLSRALFLGEEKGWREERDKIVELINHVGVRPSAKSLFETGEDLVKNVGEMEPFLEGVRRALRDLVWWGLEGGRYRDRILDPELIGMLPEDVLKRSPLCFLTWLRVVDRALGSLRAFANKRLTIEQMIIELAER